MSPYVSLGLQFFFFFALLYFWHTFDRWHWWALGQDGKEEEPEEGPEPDVIVAGLHVGRDGERPRFTERWSGPRTIFDGICTEKQKVKEAKCLEIG